MLRAYAISVMVLLSACVGATGPADVEVRAWVETQLREAVTVETLKNVMFSVAVERPFSPSKNDKNRIFGIKPGHPNIEQKIFHIRWAGVNNWRVNIDHPGTNPVQFQDVCESAENGVWLFSTDMLVLHKFSAVFPPNGDPRPLASEVFYVARVCLTGFMSQHPSGKSKILQLSTISTNKPDEIAFETDVQQADQVTIRFRGRWISSLGRGLVDSGLVLSDPIGNSKGATFKIGKWAESSVAGVWVARDVKISSVDSSTTYVDVELVPFAEEQIVSSFVPPTEAADAVRGSVSIKQVMDYRLKDPVATFPGFPEVAPVPLDKPISISTMIPWYAWALSGLGVAFVVGMRLRSLERFLSLRPKKGVAK